MHEDKSAFKCGNDIFEFGMCGRQVCSSELRSPQRKVGVPEFVAAGQFAKGSFINKIQRMSRSRSLLVFNIPKPAFDAIRVSQNILLKWDIFW